jgi:hypothetical protein
VQGDAGQRAQLAVEVGRADAGDGAAVRQHVGAPEQLALADQAGDMAGHGGTRETQGCGELLLRNEGIRADQVQQLLFF